MPASVSGVGRIQHRAKSEILLNPQRPLIDGGRVIVIRIESAGIGWEDGLPHVLERVERAIEDAGNLDDRARSSHDPNRVPGREDRLLGDGKSTAQRRFAGAKNIVGEADAGCQLQWRTLAEPFGVCRIGTENDAVAGVPGVRHERADEGSWSQYLGNRIDRDSFPGRGVNGRKIEPGNLRRLEALQRKRRAILTFPQQPGREGIETHAVIEIELAVNLPGILRIEFFARPFTSLLASE